MSWHVAFLEMQLACVMNNPWRKTTAPENCKTYRCHVRYIRKADKKNFVPMTVFLKKQNCRNWKLSCI